MSFEVVEFCHFVALRSRGNEAEASSCQAQCQSDCKGGCGAVEYNLRISLVDVALYFWHDFISFRYYLNLISFYLIIRHNLIPVDITCRIKLVN